MDVSKKIDNMFAKLKKTASEDSEYKKKLLKFKKRLELLKESKKKKGIIMIDPVGLNKILVTQDIPRTKSKLSKEVQKKCPDGKILNLKTNRCVKIKPPKIPKKHKEKNILEKIKNLQI